jgi:hypothetical protein
VVGRQRECGIKQGDADPGLRCGLQKRLGVLLPKSAQLQREDVELTLNA